MGPVPAVARCSAASPSRPIRSWAWPELRPRGPGRAGSPGRSGRTCRIRQVTAFRDQGQAPCAHVTELLHRHTADLDVRIRELQQLRGELRQLAERAATLDPERCPPERVCHVIT
jgi:MerR, DNA binding